MALIGTMRRTPKGKEPALRIIHCTLCNGFVRSEEEKDSVPQLWRMDDT